MDFIKDVLPALMAGKQAKATGPGAGPKPYRMENGTLFTGDQYSFASLNTLSSLTWEIVEEPLTDDQLIAHWESLADARMGQHGVFNQGAQLLLKCASQLRTRKL